MARMQPPGNAGDHQEIAVQSIPRQRHWGLQFPAYHALKRRAPGEETRRARWELKSGWGPYPPRPGPVPHLWEW